VRPHPCFKGSIVVAGQDPECAAREIDRLGDDPEMVHDLPDELQRRVMVDNAHAVYGPRLLAPNGVASKGDESYPVGRTSPG
jgi:hypothetical protein